MTAPHREALKEVFRLALFAAISVAVSGLLDFLGQLDPSQYGIVVSVGTVVLRYVDKFIHENPKIKATGISPI